MIAKIIGAKRDEIILSMLKEIPNVVFEFFDDEITFRNSFPPETQTSIISTKDCIIFLLVKELPIASFQNMISGNTNATQIVIKMRDKGIPLFNISYFEMGTDQKAKIIERIIGIRWSMPEITIKWHGWAI